MKYIIVNREVIQKEINELKEISNSYTEENSSVYDVDVEGFAAEKLENVLSNSIPLEQEIGKAMKHSHKWAIDVMQNKIHKSLDIKDYITQLKLDI